MEVFFLPSVLISPSTSRKPYALEEACTIWEGVLIDKKEESTSTDMPLGTAIHNIEITLGKGGQLAREAGAVAKLIAKEGLRMNAGGMLNTSKSDGKWCFQWRTGVPSIVKFRISRVEPCSISTMAFNLNGFNFNQSVVDSQGRVINTWADIINRANLGMEVMHERNAHNFPLDLAAIEARIEREFDLVRQCVVGKQGSVFSQGCSKGSPVLPSKILLFPGDSGSNIHGFVVCLMASYNSENTSFLEASCSYLSSKGAIRQCLSSKSPTNPSEDSNICPTFIREDNRKQRILNTIRNSEELRDSWRGLFQETGQLRVPLVLSASMSSEVSLAVVDFRVSTPDINKGYSNKRVRAGILTQSL
ncbi:hypothetical protein QVD17_41428 [Tagetes erecta]|uniref:Large ribosomal subunit protein uL2 C-terminal domain-containing protein n=1 Tax=Tagetes erecta TaxID=13708 RepID=A0AAD8NFJ1_TARER|nr:hypothetical protein QVD17_41428 [Tagetes erecta]